MSDSNGVDVSIEGEEVAGLDLELAREHQARAKLGIALYDRPEDKKNGIFHKLTDEERWRLDEYLGKPHQRSRGDGTAEVEDDGEKGTEAHMSHGEISEKALEHRRQMRDALDDVRGRIGIDVQDSVPEPGSAEEERVLSPIMEYIRRKVADLHRDGRAQESDPEYVDTMRAYEGFKDYVGHRKAYLGLSTYLKEHAPRIETVQESAAQEKSGQEEHRHIMEYFSGKKMR